MKRLAFIIVLGLVFFNVNAQKYMTKNGYIGFFSHTPLEDIKADNNQVASVLDASTGEIVFQVLIKSFHFAKALMETHFNESFLESEKYPRATFTGKITNIGELNLSEKGSYEAKVEGDLTIHNVTKKLNVTGTLEVVQDGINANSKFTLQPEEFNITIPSVVRNNIAKTIEVTVIMKYTAVGGK